MLRELHITGLGVIDDLDLEPHPGLKVLTGETGAGKTMITVGLSLAIGASRQRAAGARRGGRRAGAGAVRRARPRAAELGRGRRGAARTHRGADGRGAARIGGQLATAGALAELGARLVEVHGQHGSLRLLDAATQTAFLDRFAGPAHLRALEAYREAYRAARSSAVASSTPCSRPPATASASSTCSRTRSARSRRSARRPARPPRWRPRRLGSATSSASSSWRGAQARRSADDGGAADVLASAARRAGRRPAGSTPRPASLAERARALAAELAELARDVRAYRDGLAPTRRASRRCANGWPR